jgi:tetratricopeptide (TPR) repeat protein
MKKIPNGQQTAYNYDIAENNGMCHVKLDLSAVTDKQSISVELSADGSNICVGRDGVAPFLCGRLAKQIKEPKCYEDGGQFFIPLEPLDGTNDSWNIVIIGPNQENQLIDPMSAYILYHHFIENAQQSNDQKLSHAANMFLQISSAQGFVPAVNILTDLLISQGQKEQAEAMLKDCFESYQTPEIAFKLGLSFFDDIENEERVKEAEKLFKAAYESNPQLVIAKGIHALILSPYSKVKFNNKDEKKAKELFEDVLKVNDEDVISLTGLSVILYQGKEKDIQRALELNQKAKSISPEVPELVPVPPIEEEDEPEVKSSRKLWIGLGIGAAVIAIALTTGYIFNHRKSKK